jgi:Sensors of blue-light using FAD
MRLSHWLYVSNSQLSIAEMRIELEFIVDASRSRNQALGVTGALLFTGLRFLQIIEGPAPAVALLKEAISRDCRHARVSTLDEGVDGPRRYASWALAYDGPSPFVEKVIERATTAGPPAADAIKSLHRLLSTFSPLT